MPPDKAKTIYVNHQDADVYAYYPYNSAQGSSTTFNLAMGRNTPDATMLYSATQKVNNRTALATFAMKSGYSRITFRLLNMNLPYCLIKSASVTFGSAMKTQGTIDISAATPTTAAGSGYFIQLCFSSQHARFYLQFGYRYGKVGRDARPADDSRPIGAADDNQRTTDIERDAYQCNNKCNDPGGHYQWHLGTGQAIHHPAAGEGNHYFFCFQQSA